MKRSSIIVILLLTLSLSAASQRGVSRGTRPDNLARYVGEYPAALMKVPAVRARLKALLGRHYIQFDESIAVQHQVIRLGDFLLAAGCMAHLCDENEAAFIIDLKNKRIHAAILEKGEPPMYFNENKAPTPATLLNWVSERIE